LAAAKGFDPLIAENWKQIKQRDVADAGVRLFAHSNINNLLPTNYTTGFGHGYISFQ
jgi:hypothetical protein